MATAVRNTSFSAEHPRNLIPELCRQFYHLGWVTGTGGGISIKHGDEIYIAPSAVQKERMQPDDMFVQNIQGVDLELPPPGKKLKKSQCTPLFMCAYTARNAGAVIHTHSKAAVMATMLFPGKEFKCTHLEMIKGIKNQKLGRNFRYDEELVVPIIENTPFEEDLKDRLAQTIADYPETCAVLVRRHGRNPFRMGSAYAGMLSSGEHARVCAGVNFPHHHSASSRVCAGLTLKAHLQNNTMGCAGYEFIQQEFMKMLMSVSTYTVPVVPVEVYVWGDTWQLAKTMTECYDYLFDIVVQMKQHGLDPSLTPEQYELKFQKNSKSH